MSEKQQHRIVRDAHNRLCAEVSESITVGIKVLDETDERRVEKGVHAYAVLDIKTEFGPIRARNIRVMWSTQNQRHFLRWPQWNTGNVRDGRPEYLDVFGPHDRTTRTNFEKMILEVFQQIRAEAQLGTLGRDSANRRKLEEFRAINASQDDGFGQSAVEMHNLGAQGDSGSPKGE